ncbi:hypothetical protein [Roseovarius ramblicola]|uniref:Thioredoxin-like fold domain-containing protein n=1 Tax=Roseovarius ramblicola TaxID=2022336 RepID=A0ABV5I597_9RHOB
MRHRLSAATLAVTAAVTAVTFVTAARAQKGPQMSRSPLGEAIRAAMIASPGLLSGFRDTPRAPTAPYADDIARDLALLDRLAPRLFDPDRPGLGPAGAPTRIALFSRADCAPCAAARAELAALAARMGFRAALFDMGRDAGLARDLGLDTAPSYVLPDKLLRGAMPAIVLERYLRD